MPEPIESNPGGVVVTGGGSGIGRAIALGVARTGRHVVIAGRRSEALDSVVAEAPPRMVTAFPADVADETQVEELFDAAEERLGRVGGVVNAAGILAAVPSAELTLDELRSILETNVVGAFAVSRAALARMAPAGGGSIVQIASLTSLGGSPRRLAYSISKSGVLALTRTLGVEWARLGVRVNALAPGFVRTPMSDELVERGVLDLDRLEERIPVGRRAEPEEMVGPALFLLGDESRYVTGECLVADGGWQAWGGPTEALPEPTGKEQA